MRLIANLGTDRVIDELRNCLARQSSLDIATSAFSLFAFAETKELLEGIEQGQLVLGPGDGDDSQLLGGDGDRPFRNRLAARWLARKCRQWLDRSINVREAPHPLGQCLLVTNHPDAARRRVITGNCPFTTDGLGLTAGKGISLVQATQRDDEWTMFASWFSNLWNSLPAAGDAKQKLLA